MFALSKGVTNISDFLWGCYYNIRVFSPEHDANNVLKDNGLFSPLIDTLTNLECWANGFHGVYDRFLFRHSTKKYKIVDFNGFFNNFNSVIVDDVNTVSFIDIDNKTANADKIISANGGINRGNLSGFTTDLTTEVYQNCFQANFIDYSTITFENKTT
jgi:hypothetical protein